MADPNFCFVPLSASAFGRIFQIFWPLPPHPKQSPSALEKTLHWETPPKSPPGLSTSMGALGPRNASAPQDVLGPQRLLGCTGREKPLPRCFAAGLNPLGPNPFPNYPRVCLHGMGQDGVKWAGDQTEAARSRLSQPSPTFGGLVPTPHPHPGLAVPGTAQGGEARARQGVGAAPEKGLPKNAIALHKTCSSPAPLPRRWLRSFSPRLNR